MLEFNVATLMAEGAAPHTLRVFDDDLDSLRASVCEVGGQVEVAISQAVEAVIGQDQTLADEVVRNHPHTAALAAEVERSIICLIALRGPRADDLRQVLAALRIASLLSRMSECARNIAFKVSLVEGLQGVELRLLLPLSEAVRHLLQAALDAFVAQDQAAAGSAAGDEAEVDRTYAAICASVTRHMSEAPEMIPQAVSAGAPDLSVETRTVAQPADDGSPS